MTLYSTIVGRIKLFVFILLITPSFYWMYQFLINNLGINPIEKLMHNLGELALRLVVLTLFLSSLSQIKYLQSLQNIRRMIGLFAFYYVVLHLTCYVVLDHYFNWKFLFNDVIKRPFITFGFISFLLLVPLAFTSTDRIVKKLTYKVWKNLHKLIYLAAPLATIHFFLMTKADKIEPIFYMILIIILFSWKVIRKFV